MGDWRESVEKLFSKWIFQDLTDVGVCGGVGQGGRNRKSNSLDDLVPRNNTRKGPYKNVESKVKNYIASLPAPNTGSRKRAFKKHTSMPGYFGDGGISHGHSEASLGPGTCVKLEQEYSEYKRQSVHTITELQKQINVSVAMITTANNRNYELMDRIAQMHKDLQQQQQQLENRPTPETTQLQPNKLLVCTPKKKAELRGKKRMLIQEDTAGSFIGQQSAAHGVGAATAAVATIVPGEIESTDTECTPEIVIAGKRNLSFSSTGDVTRRSGTDSGINTSDENEIHIQERSNKDDDEEDDSGQNKDRKKRPTKRRRMKRLLASLICCGGGGTATTKLPKISYKKM